MTEKVKEKVKSEVSKVSVKVVVDDPKFLPMYATIASAGGDLRAHITDPIILAPNERKLIPTGLKIQLPVGFEAQIRPRSGLAFKHGITVLNTPGTIDADYRGEVKVLLINLGYDAFVIKPEERIAQMVIASHGKGEFEIVDELDETERADGGYGHTGTK